MRCEERIGLLIIAIEENEFAVVGHDLFHFPLIVCNEWPTEARVRVLIHAHVGVVGPELTVITLVGN